MLLIGKNINLRTVEIGDSEFIFMMRNNENKTKYLSKIVGTIESQEKWIRNYKKREKEKNEFYFIIESKNKEKLGLVRIYDFQGDSFCWGSWLIKDGAPKLTAIESALQIYEFGFYVLGFEKSHFDVRKDNKRVVLFHHRFGAKITHDDKLDYFFVFYKTDYEVIREKYKRYL